MTPVSPMRQARRAVLAMLGASMVLLAGCETAPRRPPPAPPAPPPAPPVEARNKVAVLVPLSGEDGPVGQSIANAANLALLDSGDTSIRLTIYNTAEAAGAAAVANRALAEGNRLILGPLLAEDVQAVAPVARNAGVPVIAFSNDVRVAGDDVYIMGTVPSQSVERVVNYARGRGAARFAALIPTGLYGQRAAQALLGAVQKSGGRVTAMETYDRTPAAVKTAIRSLNAKGGYDAVLIADSGRIAAVAAPLLKQGPSAAAHILGTELWGNERTLGATSASLRGAWYAAVPNAAFDQLVTRYRARYGKTPYRLASLGYDAVLLTVRAARNWEVGSRFPTGMLGESDGFAGVDGIFRFGRDGVAQRALEVRQVSAAGSVLLSPAARKFN